MVVEINRLVWQLWEDSVAGEVVVVFVVAMSGWSSPPGQVGLAGGPCTDRAFACAGQTEGCRKRPMGLRQWEEDEAAGGTDQEEEWKLCGQGWAHHPLSRGQDPHLTLGLGCKWMVQALRHQ